jgi:hypothetical protein
VESCLSRSSVTEWCEPNKKGHQRIENEARSATVVNGRQSPTGNPVCLSHSSVSRSRRVDQRVRNGACKARKAAANIERSMDKNGVTDDTGA